MHLQNIVVPEKAVNDQLLKAEQEIAGLAPKIKRLSFSLMPVHLATFGLAEIIKDLVENSSVAGLETNISIPKMDLHPDVSLQIFRIVQEIFTNVLKHACATQCDIAIHRANNYLVIEIRDNGTGFDSQKTARQSKGIGLANINSRVEILNGKLKMATEPDGGVHYTIKIPADASTKNHHSDR